MTAADSYSGLVAFLGRAMTGVRLGGSPVMVTDWPPVSAAGLPVAWVETLTVSRGSTKGTNVITVRFVIVPPVLETDELEIARLAAVDAMEGSGMIGPWVGNCQESVELGGVTHDAVFFETSLDYPATC